MKNLKSYRLAVVGVALLAVSIAALCLQCQRPVARTSVQIHDQHHADVDNRLKRIGDIDSLAALASRYHQEEDAVGEMLALKYQGNLLHDKSMFVKAIEVHQQGLDVATSLADTIEIITALNNLGSDYRRQGNLSTANGYYYNSLKLCDLYSHNTDSAAVKCRLKTLNGIGKIEIDLFNFPTADSIIREALVGEQLLGSNMGVAVNYANLGRLFRVRGELDSAWYYCRKSLEYSRLDNNEAGVALCHLHFGWLCEDEHRYSHALEEYKQAYDKLSELKDDWHVTETGLALARVYLKLGENQEAIKYLQQAEEEAVRSGSMDHQAEAHRIRYDLAVLQGDYKTALDHHLSADYLLDSIFGVTKNDEMRTQSIDYHGHRLSGEVDVLNNDIAHLKTMRNIQVSAALLLLLMATAIIAALVYAMRVRSRTQRLMHQIEESRSLFFTNVVHQLRTPLTSIMGSIDALIADGKQKGPESYTAMQRDNVLTISRQGKNLLMLVDRILEVGGVRSAISSLEWRRGDVVPFLRMLIDSYRERCVDRHIELTYASRESSAVIDTVLPYLTTIVGRLIENAIEYSPDFSKVLVSSRIDDNMLVVRVADDGMGISSSDLPHVFEPFYRGAAAEQLVDGVGIGLTVVRDMAMAMGGSVAVDSVKNQGSVFTVKLPCRRKTGVIKSFENLVKPLVDMTEKTARQPVELPPSEQHSGDRPVILVIEDHSDVAHLVGKVLGEKYDVHYAYDGSQGFAKVNELQPDLIITDVKMPNMDGYELCRKIHATRQLCHIPIIMLSARVSDEDRVRGIEAGADAYLVKPFIPDEIRAWAARLLDSRRQLRDVFSTPAGTIAAGTLTHDGADEDDHRFLEEFAREVDRLDSSGVKLDFDKLALTFKMGESQLRRRLQRLSGKTVVAYVTQLRMEKAKKLLQNRPDLLIGEVAEQCGFVDVAYFSRVFRQYYGMTPTQARNTPV